MSELYRDYIDGKADEIVTALGGTITPAPANAELYRDFLDRKFDDVINSINNYKPIKTYSYVGTSTVNVVHQNTITLPDEWSVILSMSMSGIFSSEKYQATIDYPIFKIQDTPLPSFCAFFINSSAGTQYRRYGDVLSTTANSITVQASNAFNAFDYRDLTYRVLYI